MTARAAGSINQSTQSVIEPEHERLLEHHAHRHARIERWVTRGASKRIERSAVEARISAAFHDLGALDVAIHTDDETHDRRSGLAASARGIGIIGLRNAAINV